MAVVFVGASYLPLFDIWYGLYSINPAPDFIAIALDESTHLNLQQRGIPSFFVEISRFKGFHSEKSYDEREVSILSELWVVRARIIKLILDSGSDVIHSDSDAFWVGDVYSLMSKSQADFVFSIAFGQPRNIVEKWGFILCMGLFMIKSSPRSRAFFDNYLRALTSEQQPNDQGVMNEILYREDPQWNKTILGNRQTRIDRYGIDILALSDKMVSRTNTHPKVRAFHPILSGDTAQKVEDSLVGIRQITRRRKFGIR